MKGTHPFVRLFSRYLREQGLTITQQREDLAQVVFSVAGHLSVEDIERCLRENGSRIGKATIYRTLELLVNSNLVEEHDFGEGFKRYEHRLSREPVHEHLICLECGNVTEFRSEEVERVESRVTREYGFVPARHRLEIYGLCRDCRSSGVELPTTGISCPIDSV
jgi:Fur family ferric uptake transcriptional regulator